MDRLRCPVGMVMMSRKAFQTSRPSLRVMHQKEKTGWLPVFLKAES